MTDETASVPSRDPPPLPPNHPSTRKTANPRPPPPKPPPHGSNAPPAPTPYTKPTKPSNPSNPNITIISAQPITKSQPFILKSRPIETGANIEEEVPPPISKLKPVASKPIPPKPANYTNFEIPSSDEKVSPGEDLPSRPSAPPNFAKKEEKQPNRPTSPPSDRFLANIIEKGTKQSIETDTPRKQPSPVRNPPPPKPSSEIVAPVVTSETDSNKSVPEMEQPTVKPRRLSTRKAPPPPNISKMPSPKENPDEPTNVDTSTIAPVSIRPAPRRPIAPVAKHENPPEIPFIISSINSPQRDKPAPPKPEQPSATQVKKPPKPVAPAAKTIPKPNASPLKPSHPGKPVTHHEPAKAPVKLKAPPLPPRPDPGHPLYKYVCTEPHGFANTHFPSTQSDVLSLSKGEFLMLLERLDDNWYYCANEGDEEGLVLVSHIKVVRKLPDEDGQMISEDKPFAVALSDYISGVEGDLNFSKGDVIFLTKYLSEGWLEGECEKTHACGMFPKRHVEIVTDLEEGPPDPADSMEGPRAKIVYDFPGDQPGDLPLFAGGMVYLLEKPNDGWYRGVLPTGGDEGIFPEGFVEVVEPLPEKEVEQQKPEPIITPAVTTEVKPVKPAKFDTGYSGKAIYDFPGGSEGDLVFTIGDVINNITILNEEWLQGELDGKEGIFPANFVEKIQNSSSETDKAEKPQKSAPMKKNTQLNEDLLPRAKALFDYNEGIEGDLSFKKSDVIDLLEKLNEDWFQGELNGMVGNFPASFVEILTPLP